MGEIKIRGGYDFFLGVMVLLFIYFLNIIFACKCVGCQYCMAFQNNMKNCVS